MFTEIDRGMIVFDDIFAVLRITPFLPLTITDDPKQRRINYYVGSVPMVTREKQSIVSYK